MPYRIAEPNVIDKQMEDACLLLHQWKDYEPAIGGGALWSWAANRSARDVDIFALSTFFSRRKARKLYIEHGEGEIYRSHYSSGYGHFMQVHHGLKFSTSLQRTGTPVDFILSKYTGLEMADRFDYKHCQVAFGLDGVLLRGARYYVDGKLTENDPPYSRTNEVINSKIQSSLWGNPEAKERLLDVMRRLNYYRGITEKYEVKSKAKAAR